MNENDFRDVAALFAMVGKLINGTPWKPEECFYLADMMVEARNAEPEQEVGIKAVRTSRKKND